MSSLFLSFIALLTCIVSNGRSRYLLVKIDDGKEHVTEKSIGMFFLQLIPYLYQLFYGKMSAMQNESLYIFQVVDPETEIALRCTHPFVGQTVKLMETDAGSILQNGATILL